MAVKLTVKQCCCGCSLKTGSYIIGVLSVLTSLAGVIYCSFRSAGSQQMSPEMARHLNVTEESREVYNIVMKAEKYICIVSAVLLSLSLVFSVMLVLAIRRENPSLMKPWLIYGVISLVCGVIIDFVFVFLFFMYVSAGAGVAMFVATIIATVLSVYLLVVVDSHRRELIGQRNPVKS